MNSKVIIIVLIALFSSSFVHHHRKTGWEGDNLKGKVKKSIKTRYVVDQYDDSITKSSVSWFITKYDSQGKVIEIENWDKLDSITSKSFIIYDENGFRIKSYSTDPMDDDTLYYENDEYGNWIKANRHYPDSIGSQPSYKEYEYDNKGRVITEKYGKKGNQSKVMRYEYDQNDNMIAEFQYTNYDSLIRITRYKYYDNSILKEYQQRDRFDRPYSINICDSNGFIHTTNYYDDGKISETYNYYTKYNDLNHRIEYRVEDDHFIFIFRYEYDKKGNIIRELSYQIDKRNEGSKEELWFETVYEYEYYE